LRDEFWRVSFCFDAGVIQLILQLESGKVPDFVIFYDGVNDVYAAYQSGRSTHQNLHRIAAKFDKGSPPPSFVEWIKSSNLFHLLEGLAAKLRQNPLNGTDLVTYKTMGIDTATLSDSVVEVYISNYEIVDALAQKYGFKFLFFWQPHISIGNKPLTSEEQNMRSGMDPALRELYDSVYRRVEQAAKKHENLYYIADMFDSLASEIWIDDAHVTPVGNRLIADKMFRVITGIGVRDDTAERAGASG
jgi:hypothetical protein